MAVGMIPFEAVDLYARRFGYEGDEFLRFKGLLGAMDAAWHKIREEQKARSDG